MKFDWAGTIIAFALWFGFGYVVGVFHEFNHPSPHSAPPIVRSR